MPDYLHKQMKKGNIVSGYSNRQRKGSDRDNGGQGYGPGHSSGSGTGVSRPVKPVEPRRKTVPGRGKLPAAGGGYQ